MSTSRHPQVLHQQNTAQSQIENIEIRNFQSQRVEDFTCHPAILKYKKLFHINIKLWVQDYQQRIVVTICTMEPLWDSARKVISRMPRRTSRFPEPSTKLMRLTLWLTRAWSRILRPCTGSSTSTTSGTKPATREWSSPSTAVKARDQERTSSRTSWPHPPRKPPHNFQCRSLTEGCSPTTLGRFLRLVQASTPQICQPLNLGLRMQRLQCPVLLEMSRSQNMEVSTKHSLRRVCFEVIQFKFSI